MTRAQSQEALARLAVQARADDDDDLGRHLGAALASPGEARSRAGRPEARSGGPREPYGAEVKARGALLELPAFTARLAALRPLEPDETHGAEPTSAERMLALLPDVRAERVLMAEAIVLGACARAQSAHRAHRFTERGGQGGMPTLSPSALDRRVRLARELGDRRALVRVVEQAEDEDRARAVDLVEALRDADEAVGRGTLLRSVGWVSVGSVGSDEPALASAVLALTEDPYVELRRQRIRARLGAGARATTLAEHGALSRTDRADEAIPLADREGIASRWCERIGMRVPSLAGGVPPPGPDHPLRLLIGDPQRAPRLIGTPSPDAHGIGELLAIVGELLSLREVGAGPIADALGVSRQHGATAATLGRHLTLGPAFLLRECAVDRGRVQDVLRELLYVELERLRTLAAATLGLHDALARAAGLGERVAETFGKALGFDHAPSRAPHRVCAAWHDQAPRWLEAAVHASTLSRSLVEQHDEDWFRNPRAGATLRTAIDGLGTLGPSGHDLPALRRAIAVWFDAAHA